MSERRYTLQEAAAEINRRHCEAFGHTPMETTVHTVAGGLHPIRLDCANGCGHSGWLLVANGPEPERRAYARDETFPLEEAQAHLRRLTCRDVGHDLDITYEPSAPGNRGEFGAAVVGTDPTGMVCRRECGHPGWRAVPVMCASHPDLLDASRG